MKDKKKKVEEMDVAPVEVEEMDAQDVQTTFNEDDLNVLVEEGEVHDNEDQNRETEEQ